MIRNTIPNVDKCRLHETDFLCVCVCIFILYLLDVKIQLVFNFIILCVLILQRCRKYYGKGRFCKDEEGYDEYCRLCAEGGDLLCCEQEGCFNGFCKVKLEIVI